VPTPTTSELAALLDAQLHTSPVLIEHQQGWNGGAWIVTLADGGQVVATHASERALTAAQAAAAAAVGPQVLATGAGWLVCGRLEGTHLDPIALSRPQVLDDVARTFARLHRLDVALPTAAMSRSLDEYVTSATTPIDADLQRLVEWARPALVHLEAHVSSRVVSHLDVAANVFLTGEGVRFIDFEYAALADPAQELGQLMWEAELGAAASARLQRAYLEGTASAVGTGSGTTDGDVAAAATWCLATGVTWAVWAHGPRPTDMSRYARRALERLRDHWAWDAVGTAPS
jgi:aminoglycoside phosphotransferase (APT) family kinase protein